MCRFHHPHHQAYWNVVTADPSTELAPYTAHRIREASASTTPPRLLAPLRVVKVEPKAGGGFLVLAQRVQEDKKDDEHDHLTGEHRVPMPKTADDFSTAVTTEITLTTPQPPVLCAGFEGSVRMGLAKDLFEWGKLDANPEGEESEKDDSDQDDSDQDDSDQEDSDKPPKPVATTAPAPTDPVVPAPSPAPASTAATSSAPGDEGEQTSEKKNSATSCADLSPLLNEFDESTMTPGLFLVGPGVQHEGMSFCFVYKFRQRFAIVAEAIARGLGYKVKRAVESCFQMNMYLDDFSCCEGACGESC